MKTGFDISREEAVRLVGSAGLLPQYGYVLLPDGRKLYGIKHSTGASYRIA